MFDEHPHDLLAQVPLTVSPYLALPTAPTLPYTYKSLPSTLPASIIDDSSTTTSSSAANATSTTTNSNTTTAATASSGAVTPTTNRPHPSSSGSPAPGPTTDNTIGTVPYVRSARGTGAATSPAALLAASEKLRAHLESRVVESGARVRSWEEEMRQRELAEKRRVAPGWLDDERRLLVPSGGAGEASLMDGRGGEGEALIDRVAVEDPDGRREGESRQGDDREGEELDRAFGRMGM